VPPVFLAAAVAGVFTGAGNSRVPFVASAIGLAANALLDPLFIFTLGMGVRGAAVATVIAQWLGCALLLYWLLAKKDRPFEKLPLRARPDGACLRQILRWTVPVSLENMLFTFFAMVVARQVAVYGSNAITVSRIGSQTESLCWLVCLGFSSGMTAFVGQNFGAGQWARIRRGLRLGLVFILGWGVLVSTLFLTTGRWLTGLFVPEEPIVSMGGEYLWILAFCQTFFCLESLAAGAFRGLGRTAPPSIASIVSNALRVPVVHYFASGDLGLNGIWWGITVTAALRGLWVFLWFAHYARTKPTRDERTSVRTSVSEKIPTAC
jgi:putative MATE family efflux protein